MARQRINPIGNEWNPPVSSRFGPAPPPPPPPNAELSIVKTQADAEIIAGDGQTYTVIVTNIGTVSAAQSLIFDALPDGFTFVDCTIAYTGAALGPATATEAELAAGIAITAFPVGTSVTLTITGSFEDPGEFTNTATAIPPTGSTVEDSVITEVVSACVPPSFVLSAEVIEPAVGLWVATAGVAGLNSVMTSPDGVTWTSRDAAVSDGSWEDVVWAPELELFAAVSSDGAGNRIMTSPDGITWTGRTSAGDLTAIAWNGTKFLAPINGTQAYTSTDGITWTLGATTNNVEVPRGLCWSGSAFCCVGPAGSPYQRTAVSADGITWASNDGSVTESNLIFDVCWSEDLEIFCAVAQGLDEWRIMTSPNGIAWTVQSDPLGSSSLNTMMGVCWASELGLFCAVGYAAASGATPLIATSPDGVTWTQRTSGDTNALTRVKWNGSLFVAVGFNGDYRVQTSPDGITWTSREAAQHGSFQDYWYGLAWAPGLL